MSQTLKMEIFDYIFHNLGITSDQAIYIQNDLLEIFSREIKREREEFLADIDAYLDSEHTDPCDLDSKYWKARREKWEKKRK